MHRVIATNARELPSQLRWVLDDDLVLVVPPHGHRLLAGDHELAAALEYFDADAIFARGDTLAGFGYAAALRALAAGETINGAVDVDGEVIAAVRNLDVDLIRIGGRWVSAYDCHALLAAFADPSLPEPDLQGGKHFASVIAYEDAIEEAGDEPTPVANEILLLPFWTPDFCARVIDVVEHLGQWGSDDTDPVPGDEVSLMAVSPRLFAIVEADLADRIVPCLRRHWSEFAWCGLHDAFVIRYAARGHSPSSLALHHDVAQISGSVRLNAAFAGGQLEFPRQGYDNRDAPIGALLAWPSLVTHPHRAAPVREGTKYGLTLWLRLPET